jgi:tyrosine-specific transport protein
MIFLLKNRQFLKGTAVLVGAMVGVGIFGIPFAFAKAGFWIGFLFLLGVGGATLLLNLIYGEIILRTHQEHQMVGYTQLYLGDIWKRIIFFSIILTTYAGLLAYIIIAGEFLPNVLSPLVYASPNTFSIWFFAVASLLVLFGIRTVSSVELVLAGLFMAVIFLIFIFGIGHVDFANYSVINSEFWFFPYGVLLFAFSGLAAIPIQRQVLADGERWFKSSISLAVLFVGILYLIFGFTILGLTGEATSPDAISGLIGGLNGNIIFLCSLFGVLAVSTSYLMLGTSMLQVFHLDYGFSRKMSWLMTVSPPFILFIGGLRNFIDVISLAGGVAIGLEAVILIMVFVKAKTHGDRIPEYSMRLPVWLLYVMALIFLGGLGYTLITR